MTFFILVCLVVVGVTFPNITYAILPPDIVISLGTQFVQVFALVSVFVGGTIGSLAVLGKRWLAFNVKTVMYGLFLFSLLLLAILIALTIRHSYIVNLQNNQVVFLEEQNQLLQEGLSGVGTTTQYVEHSFFSDTITLYSDELPEPFVMEIDLNRKAFQLGQYEQYAFLDGSWDGTPFHNYTYLRTTSPTPQADDFIISFERQRFVDLSTRDSYTLTLQIKGDLMTVTIPQVVGDFVTRNDLAYTRIQSVARAEVAYRGETFTADALVESTYSNDYRQYIFFPEYDEVVTQTHQFILWDEVGNFYLIDDSDVTPFTPSYPSHTWLLHKDTRTDTTRKSFDATIRTQTSVDDIPAWTIQIPQFDLATFTLSPTHTFKDETNRKRMLVTGTVEDTNGTRSISGSLHLVQ